MAALRALAQREQEEEARKWRRVARPNQLMPDGFDYRVWLLLAGRGFGKTRAAAEAVREKVESRQFKRIALVGATASDCRDVMVEGESGIMSLAWDKDNYPIYEPTKRRLTWPKLGVIATTYSADEPERLRGPQHDFFWADELCAWFNPQAAWDQLMLGWRLGKHPQGIVSTTPKPLKLIREIAKSATTRVTRGSSYENRDNLAPAFFEQILSRYQGTRLGRQEIEADLLEDTPDALFKRSLIDACRVTREQLPNMRRIVVALDPAVTSNEESDMTGIIVCGLGEDNQAYILADRSGRMSPDGWCRTAIRAFYEFEADGIIGEVNNGGDLIETTLRAIDANIPFRSVRASRGKIARAEPVSTLYEQRRVHHLGPQDPLEDQLCQMTSLEYTGVGSPDRADAMVWGVSELMVNKSSGTVSFLGEFQAKRQGSVPAKSHVVEPLPLPTAWAYKWISAAWGNRTAAHWYSEEPDKRVHVFREFSADAISAEAFGTCLARLSQDLLNSRMRRIAAHLPAEHFSSQFGGRSVAELIAHGIDRELGQASTFVWQFTPEETKLGDASERMDSLMGRREKVDGLLVTLQPVNVEEVAGWEHLRYLLKTEGDPQATINFDRDFALSLLLGDGGAERFREYMLAVDGTKKTEVFPKIVFHEDAVELIKSLGSMVRDEKNPELPKDKSASALSLLLGVLAHRQAQSREPAEAAIGRKLADFVNRNPDADAQRLYMVELKARGDFDSKRPKTIYRFGVRRRRR